MNERRRVNDEEIPHLRQNKLAIFISLVFLKEDLKQMQFMVTKGKAKDLKPLINLRKVILTF